MKKLGSILILIVLFLMYSTGKLLMDNIKLTNESHRKDGNIKALTDSLTTTTDRQGRHITEISALTTTVQEFKTTFPELAKQINQLNAKVSRTANITEVHTISEKQIQTIVKDSTIYTTRDTTQVKAINYTDPFYTVTGHITADSARLKITSIDTLIQVIHQGKRIKPHLWIFSRRQLTQTIRTANPANRVIYSRYIEIKK